MGSGTVALGVVGNITAMIMFLSPLPTFFLIRKQKGTGRFSAFPYICTLMNCLLWFFYGLPMVSENNILVMTINGAGIIIESIYLIVFLYYAAWPIKTQVLRSLVFVFFFCAITFAITLGAFQGDDRTTFLGSINVIINTIMYAAPLSVMRLVIETKSVEYMPFMLSLCSFVNATLWALYGILKEDKFIIIPNGLGVLLGALQLGLYAKYRKYKAPPTNLTENISAAFTTEGATATDLSDIITRGGGGDLPDTVSKGATSIGPARYPQQGPGILPPTTSPPPSFTPAPASSRPHQLHSESLKVELMGGPRPRDDQAKANQRLLKSASAPERPVNPDAHHLPAVAPSPPPAPVAPAAPQLHHAPTLKEAPASRAAPASELFPSLKPAEAPQAPQVKEAAPKTFKEALTSGDQASSALHPPEATAAPSHPAATAKSFKDALVSQASKVAECVRELPAKLEHQAASRVAAATGGAQDQLQVIPGDESDPRAAAEFSRMKAEEQKRADELRRLQEAFDEEEYGAELETIFL